MSRRLRMHIVQYRRWAPPQSPLHVEFSPELFREIRMECASRDGVGLLYGMKHGNVVRVLAARKGAYMGPPEIEMDRQDPRLADLAVAGTFAMRVRGDVFLTEGDLKRFDQAEGCVALVIAADRGGFFVKNLDGAIQSIQSYEEFSLRDGAASLPFAPPPPAARKPVANVTSPRFGRRPWIAATIAASMLIGIPIMAAPLWKPLLPKPRIQLSVLQDRGQLRITWNRAALRGHATLEIVDGPENTVRAVDGQQSGAVYSPRSGEIEVRLSDIEDGGVMRREVARYVGRPPVEELDVVRNKIAELQDEAERLRVYMDRGRTRLATLQRLTEGRVMVEDGKVVRPR